MIDHGPRNKWGFGLRARKYNFCLPSITFEASLPPSLPPVSFKNILNAIPTRQFQKKTVKERNLLR
jgi:hypothetical protein